jgi:hypothetical protein
MISTKDIQGGEVKTQKTLSPGNHKITILNVKLNRPPYSTDGYEVHLNVVGPDLGPGFEGFFIDKDNESLGRYKGQIGRVKSSKWIYETKSVGEYNFNRDLEILKFIKQLCTALECEKWFDDQDNKHETIESFINQFNEDAPYKDKELYTCIAGRQYENKAGYKNWDLYFPKFSKMGIPFEKFNADLTKSRVYKFNEDEHAIRLKEKDTKNDEVDSFSTEESDFELG